MSSGDANLYPTHGLRDMNHIEDHHLISCLRHVCLPIDMNAYDAAACCAAIELMERSNVTSSTPLLTCKPSGK